MTRAALLLVLLPACRSQCTEPQADMPIARVLRWVSSELGAPESTKEIAGGSGRYVQLGRRALVDVAVRAEGRELGSGTMEIEYPLWEVDGETLRRRSSPGIESELFTGIAGMQEGGTREFTFRALLSYPSKCEPRHGQCHLWIGSRDIAYPPNVPITMRATVKKICAPSYCVETTYSIPLMTSHRLVERSCN